MSTHTPGPWRIEARTAKPVPSNRPLRLLAIGPMEPSGSYVQAPAVTIVYLDNFLEGVSGGFRDDEGQANARLIAAAPDLLESLSALFAITDLGDYVYDIREREGQGWDGPKVVAWGNACASAKAAIAKATGEASS